MAHRHTNTRTFRHWLRCHPDIFWWYFWHRTAICQHYYHRHSLYLPPLKHFLCWNRNLLRLVTLLCIKLIVFTHIQYLKFFVFIFSFFFILFFFFFAFSKKKRFSKHLFPSISCLIFKHIFLNRKDWKRKNLACFFFP